MENIFKYKKTILIIIGIMFVLSVILLIYFNFILFRITSTYPKNNGKVNIGQSVVIFDFTKEIEPVDIKTQVVSSKDILISSENDKKRLIIYVKNIQKNENYFIEIKNIKSKSGEYINSSKINFVGAYIKASDLSKQVYEVTARQTDSSPVPGSDDPVTKILPKRTTEFSLNYLIYSSPSQKGKYISIQAVLFVPDYELNNTALLKDYKNKALDYLKSNNINPNNYVIDWNPKSAANL